MRPPLRSIRHTKTPRADHNTVLPTPIASPGSMADRQSTCREWGRSGTAPNREPSDTPRGRNQRWRAAFVMADGHPFPLPRAWPVNVGRSRYADRLRPNFLLSNFLLKVSSIASARRTSELGMLMPARQALTLGRICKFTTVALLYRVAWRSLGLRSRWRALRPKNSAWLTTADTTATWNGFAIRKAGSGRCPVRKRSG